MIGPAEIAELEAEYEEAVARFAGTLVKPQAEPPEEVSDLAAPASRSPQPPTDRER